MINPKKIIKLVMKCQREAAAIGGRKGISLPRTNVRGGSKGHFVIYTTDQKRFVIPLIHLNSNIFIELLKMSEDEFGLPRDGPITLPCEAVLMKYIVKIIQRGVTKDVEKALLIFIATSRCSLSSFHQAETGKKLPTY